MTEFFDWFFKKEREKAFYGHAGRPGKVGGSVPASSAMSRTTGAAAVARMAGKPGSKIGNASGGSVGKQEIKKKPITHGSEKQITWANSIRDTAISKNESLMENAQARHDHLYKRAVEQHDAKSVEFENNFLEARKIIYKLAKEKLYGMDDAKNIIDNRTRMITSIFKENLSSLSKKDIGILRNAVLTEGMTQRDAVNALYEFIE